MKAITKSNVISADVYKEMVLEVLKFTSDTVCKTLGPCANTSIIEEMGPLVASKDGFHTLQRIRFAPDDIFANNVVNVIKEMSHRMVTTVGDGSSSAIVAAWKFANLLYNKKRNIRPKEFADTYKKAINMIIERITESAVRVTDEELPEIMYQTSLVSTNGNKKFADMIKEIYTTSKDNVFTLVRSNKWEDELSYNRITGYKAKQYYMVDNIFCNRPGEFVGKDVYIICFDMSIDSYHYNMIQKLAQLAHRKAQDNITGKQCEIVICAPSYSQNFLDLVKRDVDRDIQLIQAKQLRHLSIRYMRCLNINAYQRNDFMDFAMLAGSNPITSSDFNKMVNIMTSEENFDEEILERAIGKVNSIRVYRNEYTLIDGFPELDESRYEAVLNQVKSDYERELNENKNRRITSVAFANFKNRLQKLQRKVVEVVVGADSAINLELLYDAAEDATRACESVAQYGYNIGGNLAIILACDDIYRETEDEELRDALDLIAYAFKNTFAEVYANKFTSSGFDSLDKKQKFNDILKNCIETRQMYDIITNTFTRKIINSAQTDIEILKGAINICITLMTANQYISQFPNIDNN